MFGDFNVNPEFILLRIYYLVLIQNLWNRTHMTYLQQRLFEHLMCMHESMLALAPIDWLEATGGLFCENCCNCVLRNLFQISLNDPWRILWLFAASIVRIQLPRVSFERLHCIQENNRIRPIQYHLVYTSCLIARHDLLKHR